MAPIPIYVHTVPVTLLVVVLVGLAGPVRAADQGDGVLRLTADNFKRETTAGPPVLVYYYTSWCKHCVATTPVIEELAAMLKGRRELRVRLAKVDAEKHMKLAETELVSGFPTIRLYWQGGKADFSGMRSAINIVRWLERKVGEGVQKITSVSEADGFLSQQSVSVLGFFKDPKSEAAKAFQSVGRVIDKLPFGMTDNEDMFKKYNVQDGTVSVFKTFDDGRVDWHFAGSEFGLRDFLESSVRPLVVDYSSSVVSEVFGSERSPNKSAVFVLFLRAGHYEEHLDVLRSVAFDHRSNLSFVTVNADEADSKLVFTAFELDAAGALPAMRIFNFDTNEKFAPLSAQVSGSAMRAFIKGVAAGTIKPAVPSEDLPEDWDRLPVKVLVRSNFEQVVFDGRNDVIVMFHTDTCQHCIAITPTYKKVGQLFQGEPSVVVAAINVNKNSVSDVSGVELPGVPSIVLYPKCGKRPVLFSGDRTVENIAKFLREGMSHGSSSEDDDDMEVRVQPDSSESDRDEL